MKNYLQSIERELLAFNFGTEPEELYDPIRYVLGLGGKRIRPVLTLMACDMYCNDIGRALYPALGVEVFHNFTLLHDDIMDNAPLRRGKATVHIKWDSNVAILSGDVMLIRAYDLMLKTNYPDISFVLKKFNACAAEVCKGQQLDMNFESIDRITETEYLDMIRKKTAVLLAFSLELGAILGSAPKEDCDLLYQFGINTGIGFQLKDDLLDVFAEGDAFGKQVGGDIISNKKTFLLIKALELANGATKSELDKWLAMKEFDPAKKVEAVMNIYNQLGIKNLTEGRMNEFFDRAFNIIEQLPLDAVRKEPLVQFAKKLIDRKN